MGWLRLWLMMSQGREAGLGSTDDRGGPRTPGPDRVGPIRSLASDRAGAGGQGRRGGGSRSERGLGADPQKFTKMTAPNESELPVEIINLLRLLSHDLVHAQQDPHTTLNPAAILTKAAPLVRSLPTQLVITLVECLRFVRFFFSF